MCIELDTITTFVYLATWSAIIYYVTVPQPRIVQVITLIAANAVVLCMHLDSDCSITYVKVGAATEAVLLFVLFHGFSGISTRDTRAPQAAGGDQTKNRSLEEQTAGES